MITIVLVAFYFLFPLVIFYGDKKSKTLQKIGTVVPAYIIGIFLGNIGIFPKATSNFSEALGEKAFLPKSEILDLLNGGIITQQDFLLNQIHWTQDLITTIVIPLSIPLLLFSLNIKRSFSHMRKGMLSLVLAIISLIIVVLCGHLIFRNHIDEAWKIGGMLMGIYTGGTPNLAAISQALDVSPNTFVLTHTYDLMLCTVVLLFFIGGAQKLFNKFLPSFTHESKHPGSNIDIDNQELHHKSKKLTKSEITDAIKGLGVSILIFACSGAISLLVPQSVQTAVVILCITTTAILLAAFTKVSKLKKTFDLGMYLIIVFSLVVASMADLRMMFSIDYLNLFLYVAFVVVGSIVVHALFSKIFKVDTDTTIISMTAMSFSPPFVPVVAHALKNRDLILTGITIGVIGYAVGNYLGVFIGYLLRFIS